MSSYSASNERGGRADRSDSLPYIGLSSLALGLFGVAVMVPFALAVDPVVFFRNISAIHFGGGLGLASLTDYTLSRLTNNGTSWPQLPAWVGSTRTNIVSTLLYCAGVIGLYFFTPSWIPALVIGGMHAFAVGSLITICIGSFRSGSWAVRHVV